MTRPSKSLRWLRLAGSRRWRMVGLAMAALPICQATGCFPDPLGALNFQLQFLIDSTLVNALNIFVQNIFHL